MENYSIKCFVVDPSEGLRSTITKLITNHNFIVDKGWENGYHLHLRGELDVTTLQPFVSELEKGVSESLTNYDDSEFIHKYESTARILDSSKPFNPIHKDKVIVNIENSIFSKDLEDNLFRQTNHIFDSYYCNEYFKENSLYQVIEEVMKFHSSLEEYEERGYLDGLAYNCHLSHYIAFINRLNTKEKERVEREFRRKYEKDFEEGLLNFNLGQTPLTKDLMEFFHQIRPLVRKKELNFYMPFRREQLNQKLESASQRHKATFSEDNTHYFLYNDVVIANRWVTNALYKKLLLLGLSNLDRFYMNYVISRLTYPERELNDYAMQ
ncbi:hypothetical protein [Halobacillus litoralis]|uniref:hypothetical protein n=1 Tax=Halobacillus litoralis TaxID=45668 RepID=UPI001367DD8F|nr:hypothetical protein [Halobacillus litoralis]MYL39810.1 hypothetical protein [Halobacillus litoralis]